MDAPVVTSPDRAAAPAAAGVTCIGMAVPVPDSRCTGPPAAGPASCCRSSPQRSAPDRRSPLLLFLWCRAGAGARASFAPLSDSASALSLKGLGAGLPVPAPEAGSSIACCLSQDGRWSPTSGDSAARFTILLLPVCRPCPSACTEGDIALPLPPDHRSLFSAIPRSAALSTAAARVISRGAGRLLGATIMPPGGGGR
ncbi:hypothetical protein GDO81_029025 [Engystomops pustulosus]|uniref:Uncharacterized protein n=1 Tax=Engystomops pustulosus TaxID=76066 RepID=A0AAV6Z4T6_ENGPU|nr:hypothetical protein GDO81_029025 [Engystomops pustulosus]